MSHTQVIAMQARTFLDAYEALKDSMLQRVQHGDLHFRIPVLERIPVLTPAITCLAFAAEMAIKALIVQSADGRLSASPRNLHDLDKLFNEVPSDIRVEIAKTMGKTPSEVEENLERNAKAFVKWRYSYEDGAWADEEFLRTFTKIALARVV